MNTSEQIGRQKLAPRPKHRPLHIVGLLVASTAFTCAPMFAQGPTLSLASGKANPGGSVALNISFSNPGSTSPGSLQWTMTYSAADITAVSVAVGSAASSANKTVTCNNASGTTVCVASGLDENTLGAGTVATATFQIASNAKDTSVPVQLTAMAAADDSSALGVSATGGAIALSGAPSGPPSTAAVSVWNPSATPSIVTVSDGSAVELGMKFRSDVAGQVTGVRFYKGPQNTGTHIGHLWDSSGKLLGTVTFQNETASGWQTATFGSPIAIQANTTYVVSYYAPAGYYSANTSFFTSAVNNPPLHALQSGTDGPNGVYEYGTSAFPAQSYNANNYWVDVLFVPSSGSSTSPGSGTSASNSIWSATATPGTVSDPDSSAVELGMKFRSDVAGQVTGVRFYKGPQNTGAHVGHLWSSNGVLLGTVNFSGETNSGWQQANFATPVSIQANTTYIVSYYAPAGHYSSDTGFFSSAVNAPPLHALQNGADGANGVYRYGASGFPNQSWNSSNYWVDLTFSPAVK